MLNNMQLIAEGTTGALLQVAGLSAPITWAVLKMMKKIEEQPKKKKVKMKRPTPHFVRVKEPKSYKPRKSAFVTAE